MRHYKYKFKFALIVEIEGDETNTWDRFEKLKKELSFLKLTTPGSKVKDAFADMMLSEEIISDN